MDVHTTSFVKDKFKSNMKKVGCFEKVKKKLKHVNQVLEHSDLEQAYDSILEAYNDIVDDINTD